MSRHHLPEDPSRWPADPYRLLGVPHHVTAPDLRLAYARLIKICKPEQAPEAFRRIREAYEAVLCFVTLLPACPEEAQPLFQEVGQISPPSAVCGHDPELRELWKLACQSQEPAAYELGLRLHQTHPGDGELCVRLYWLLTLFPGLDPQRRPCDWLCQALAGSGQSATVRELYRREILAEPREGLSGRYRALLATTTEPGPLLNLANWRWQAAAALAEWQIIPEDLDFLRDRMRLDEKGTWPRLLLVAISYLAWGRREFTRECMEQCSAELRELVEVGSLLEYQLDQLDFLEQLSEEWEKLQGRVGLADKLYRLIPLSWTRPFEEAQAELRGFLADVCRNPVEALRSFDSVHEQASAVLAHFERLLNQLAHCTHVEGRSPSEGLRRLVHEFLHDQAWQDYWGLRPRLLRFCLEEVLSPEEVVPLIEGDRAFQVAELHLAEYLTEDWSLRAVCWAHRLFWA
jgi:hypothetical protein